MKKEISDSYYKHLEHGFKAGILLTAETKGVKFEQPFNNLAAYLERAEELKGLGFIITSWYDSELLARLS